MFVNGLASAKQIGWEQGLEEGKIQVARRMLASGMGAAEVARFTGMAVEEGEWAVFRGE